MPTTLDQQVAQRLTRLYMIALMAVGLLSITGQILIQYSLKDSLDDAHVVNIAGRQRMLSQRLVKMAILLINSENLAGEASFYKDDYRETLALWNKCHEGLINGHLAVEHEVYVKNSEHTRRMLQELDPIFNDLNNKMTLILNNKSFNKDEILHQILLDERLFLDKMDSIVFQYDSESKERVKRMRYIEFSLFIVTFAVLLLEGLLIFKPLASYIRTVIKKLVDSEETLRLKNQELSIANQKLLDTQNDLLRMTEEKFELIRKEDKVRSGALLEGQEEERRRLSRELHDGIGQMLTGLKLHSEKFKSLTIDNEKQKKIFDDHSKLIEETIEATRLASFNLMPAVLTDFGLSAAIRLLAEHTTKASGIVVDVETNLEKKRLNTNLEVNLYRITQEAINNTVKHANATNAKVMLWRQKNEIELLITDNGVGFDPKYLKKDSSSKNGLSNMKTRVNLLGGSIKIDTKPTKGTNIIIKIPDYND